DYGEIRPFGPAALARDKPWLAPINVTERLWYLGFIQRAFDMASDVRGEIFYIPDEILPHLPKPPAPAGFTVKTVPAPDNSTTHADKLMWDTFILLAHVARVEPPYAEGTLLSVDELRSLDEQV